MVEAKRLKRHRAIISMQKAVKENEGGIYAIGNAPTALLELIVLLKKGLLNPT